MKRNAGLTIGAATVMLLGLGILYTWSIFRVQLAEVFPGLSAAQLSMNFSIVSIGFCLGGFGGGKLAERKSQRFAVRLAAGMIFIGFMGCSMMEGRSESAALGMLYVFYGVFCGVGVGIGYNACVSGTTPWFPNRLGLVSGILLMGFGFGSMVLGFAVEALYVVMSVFGVFRLAAVGIPIVLIAGSFTMKKPESGTQDTSDGLRPGQMLKRPSFWIYFVWNTVAASSGLLVINSCANIAAAFGAAASLGLIVSLFNGAGRPVTGAVMDKLGQFRGMLVMNGILLTGGALLVVAAKTGAAGAVFAGMIFVGICYGGGVTISSKVIRDLYGPQYYGVNFSLSNFCMIPAAFIGPYLSGVLQDRSGGRYDGTFLMVVIMALIALASIFVLKGQIRRESAK